MRKLIQDKNIQKECKLLLRKWQKIIREYIKKYKINKEDDSTLNKNGENSVNKENKKMSLFSENSVNKENSIDSKEIKASVSLPIKRSQNGIYF